MLNTSLETNLPVSFCYVPVNVYPQRRGDVGNLTKLMIPRVGMFDKVAQEPGT